MEQMLDLQSNTYCFVKKFSKGIYKMIGNGSDCKKKKKYDALPPTNERDINRVQHFIATNLCSNKMSNLSAGVRSVEQ